MNNDLLVFGAPATFGSLVVTGVIACAVLLGCFCAFMYVRTQLQTEQSRTLFLERYQALQKEYYENLLHSGYLIRLLRHDVSNHLQTVHLLLEESPDSAAVYLQQVKQTILRAVPTTEDKKSLVYVLLKKHQHIAKKSGCQIDLQIAPNLAQRNFAIPLIALLIDMLDIALLGALPNSVVAIEPLPGVANGVQIRYVGTFPFACRTQWSTLYALAKSYDATMQRKKHSKTFTLSILMENTANGLTEFSTKDL